MSKTLKCPFCGYEFEMAEAEKGCKGCPFSRTCHKIKCPNCGYEMAESIKLPKFLRKAAMIKNESRGHCL
ncbi:hypothetical protein [Mahella australiensis]|uniref:Uncharacterized protein n=1 Tax=Mahella australiensis (strain DSM 15567 / CIP 107919 / 50-1 BON) TaxID=697281 RepID=F4A0K9_MAHA5|nr:hypothetical protein [Mahella australiensis]AEE95888.1 hypothetical protein Mahau_0685 [Mahella australiensis 50-1 BON]